MITTCASTMLLAGLLGGCGQSASSQPTGASNSAPSSSADQAAQNKRECTAADIKVSGAFGKKPDIKLPTDCKPPTKLVVKDLKQGTGKGVKAGDTATVNYELKTWSDGKVLDNSYDRGEPFPVQNVGKAQVIEGWNKGLIGMKKDARRLLIIPPSLGYGEGGQGIAPNETLVFVIDGVSVKPGAAYGKS
jgi:peptidylprolyl isomerase